MQETISEAQWQTFEEKGYVRLGRVVTDEELEGLRLRIDEIMLGKADVPYERMMMQLDTSTGQYKDMDPLQRPGVFLDTPLTYSRSKRRVHHEQGY